MTQSFLKDIKDEAKGQMLSMLGVETDVKPSMKDPGDILVRAYPLEEKNESGEAKMVVEELESGGGAVHFIREGQGVEFWIEYNVHPSEFPEPGIYLIEDITGVYSPAVPGLYEADEDYEYSAIRKLTAEEIADRGYTEDGELLQSPDISGPN